MTPERRASILDPFITELGMSEKAEAIESLMADLVRSKSEIDTLRTSAEPFIHHSAKLVSQSTDGKAYVAIEVPMEDILNLRKALKGS